MTQQLVLEPLGIITEPNKIGSIPAGGMSSALNIAIRSPGVVESQPSIGSFANIGSDAGTTAAFVVAPPGPLLLVIFNRTAGWFYQWINQSTGASVYGPSALSFTLGGVAYSQSIPLTRQPGFSYVIHGEQLLVNMFSTVIVWDTYDPANSTEATPRPAGLFPPQLLEVAFGTSPGTALAAGRYAIYTAIYKRQVGDTLMVSAPSPAMSSRGLVPSIGSNVPMTIAFNELVKAGDVLEIYRTKSKPAGPMGSYLSYQQGEEAGAEYQKATSVILTAADIASGSITVTDKTPDTSLGEALYTNQAAKGSQGAAAFPPPALRFMTSHKGHAFGFGTTMPPSITIRPTGTWADFLGADAATASSGIGRSTLTGCTWSNGGTTVTVSPSSQLGFVKLGMQVFGTGITGSVVTAIGGSTFTFTPAASGAGAATTCTVADVFSVNGSTLFATSWRFFPFAVGTDDELMLIAPALKLPPVTPVNFDAQPIDGFTIQRKLLNDARTTFGVKGSSDKNWDPDVAPYQGVATTPAIIEEKPRAMVWSEQNQPESWPFVQNDTFARGQPCAFASTRDCIIGFYTDAIWRISGTGGTAGTGYDWRADPIATHITIQGSQAICVHGDNVYAMTSEGLLEFDSNGSMRNITKGRVHDQLACPPWTDGAYTLSTACFLVADEEHNEIIMREPSAASGVLWVYNVATDTLVHRSIPDGMPIHGDYSRTLRKPVFVGQDAGGWRVFRSSTTAYANAEYTYQPVYAENPFSQRQWQSVDLSAEPSVNGPYFSVTCNGVATSATGLRALTNGRLSVEVPRNAPAIGNVMSIAVYAGANAEACRINGVALNYVDQTERRRAR